MTPWDYHKFRGALGHGSGFDSPGFRRVAHSSPPLGDAFMDRMAAAGVSLEELYVQSQRFETLYQVAEQLVEWDERVALWKYHHFKMVERMIGGHVIGTQGQPVEILSARLGLMFYPELWQVRNRLTERAQG
jgi:tryptophan 2,3-dioxygenase